MWDLRRMVQSSCGKTQPSGTPALIAAGVHGQSTSPRSLHRGCNLLTSDDGRSPDAIPNARRNGRPEYSFHRQHRTARTKQFARKRVGYSGAGSSPLRPLGGLPWCHCCARCRTHGGRVHCGSRWQHCNTRDLLFSTSTPDRKCASVEHLQ
jgi:hypothetical protein